MLQRLLKTEPVSDNQMQIPLENGEPGLVFPNNVIDNLRYLMAHLQRDQIFPERLALVSALRGEGVTYLSYALAGMLASDLGVRVGVVDLNWHWPHRTPFASPEAPGLAQVIAKQAQIDDIIAPTGWPNLAVLPAGEIEPNRRPATARSETLRWLLTEAMTRFDHLILDIPAILATSDSVPLAGLADGCVLVVRHAITGAGDVRAALDEISHLSVKGVLLNRAHYATPAPLVKLILGQQ